MLAACAGADTASPVTTPSPARSEAAGPSPPAPAAHASPIGAGEVYARIQPDLQACYVAGLRATPEMADAQITLDASFNARGDATCAIPRDDAGFTQDVADCMAAALGKASVARAESVVSMRIVARSSTLSLGPPVAASALLANVETVRMPDAFDVLESLEPALGACVLRGGGTSLVVSARVGSTGVPECALATGARAAAECAATVLRNAKFPPPKRGSGVVVVPIALQ